MRKQITAWAVCIASAAVGASIAAPAAEAQYFGRNKVQYERFDFQVLETQHFDIYYYPEMREAAYLAARMAERWYARISTLLIHELKGRQPLILYANHPHFEQTNAIAGEIGEATGGVTEAFKRRIVLPFTGSLKETDHVLGHELIHAFQFDITGEGRSVQTGGFPTALRLPLWFVEGMAEYLSVGPHDPHTAMWLREGARDRLPTITQLSDPFRWFPYRWGQAAWAYITGVYGDEIVGRLLRAAGRSTNPETAITRILGRTMDDISVSWHAAIREQGEQVAERTRSISDYGEPILREEPRGINIAPSISPDGRLVAFLSERDLFSIELFVADIESGRVLYRVTRTVADPHLESLQFINSAGAWSPEGTHFAIAGISRGQPIISIIDISTRRTSDEILLPQLGEVLNPSWSPDGRTLAFSAVIGGFTDLFLYDLEDRELRRMTNDPYADLQPAWSPDGRRIAFVTDRFTTDLDQLVYGPYQLAVMDAATGAVEHVPAFSRGKHINPQWSPDGQSLYFLSDRDGITNMYRISLSDGAAYQVTNVYSGVSGISASSPALSVAAESGRAVVSVFGAEGFRLYGIDEADVLAGEPAGEGLTDIDPGRLPPARRITEQVPGVLADHTTGLPDPETFIERPYRATLGLDYVARPTFGLAVDRFGTYIGAGAALFWSDMLGDRNLMTALEINGTIRDVSAQVAYANLRNRLNWVVAAQQLVTTVGGFRTGVFFVEGIPEPVEIQLIQRFRQTSRAVMGQFHYPLNRAQRVEWSAGIRNIGFEFEEIQRMIGVLSGQVILDERTRERLADPVTLGTGSLAFVYDKSLMGATSPLIGQRYRFEVAPVVGSVNYVAVLGDYRRYVMPMRPFTLAFQALHMGRYGRGGEDRRFSDLFIGSPQLVRGYSDQSFDASECLGTGLAPRFEPGPGDPCPIFNQLLGSRLAVAKAEVRFPPLRLLGAGGGYYGFLPMELAVFADAGLAWYTSALSTETANREAFFLSAGGRRPVTSAGTTLRVNLFGLTLIQLDYARAFQRKRWVWQFSFSQGF